ncbi:MAG: hypothetical protein PHW27_06770, partial [Melioribacteraceae bacterium]|nr:hypothetical protein [Melioribacteraceae bacterium]
PFQVLLEVLLLHWADRRMVYSLRLVEIFPLGSLVLILANYKYNQHKILIEIFLLEEIVREFFVPEIVIS